MYLSYVSFDSFYSNNFYLLHQVVWRLFPNKRDETRPFLFRIESINSNTCVVVIRSKYEPYMDDSIVTVIESKPLYWNFYRGEHYYFKVRTNPSRNVRKDNNPEVTTKSGYVLRRSSRIPLTSDLGRMEWLENKFGKAASVLNLEIQEESPEKFFKEREKHHGVLWPVLFFGEIRVLTPELLDGLFINGVGPSKAFGFGMLTLTKKMERESCK